MVQGRDRALEADRISRGSMTRRFDQIHEGEWIEPKHRGFKLACCDCGLTHRIDYRIVAGRVQFRTYRDSKTTAGLRRRIKEKCAD
jgi:hypothetical protein